MTHPAAYMPLSGYLLRVVRGDLPMTFDAVYAPPEAVAVESARGADRELWYAAEADRFAAMSDAEWWDRVAVDRREWAERYRRIESAAAA
jgi:hypothetical protein